MELEGKTALVTGASKGIGKAIVDALEKEGCKVIKISRTDGYDVTKDEDMKKITELVLDCDILINNVGGGGTWKIQDWFKV